jgi:hypothetical protein
MRRVGFLGGERAYGEWGRMAPIAAAKQREALALCLPERKEARLQTQ